MSMLVDSVPHSLLIAGTEYKINTDYRVWIKYQLILESEEGSDEEIFQKILTLVFPDEKPPALYNEETAEQIMWFYRCGKPVPKSTGKHETIFSYEYDDGYIAAAFMEQYHIDLENTHIHWWKFYAYLLAVSDKTELAKIMAYRSVEVSSKMPPEQRQFYQRMKKLYKLPKRKKEQEHNDALEQALLAGKPIDGLL